MPQQGSIRGREIRSGSHWKGWKPCIPSGNVMKCGLLTWLEPSSDLPAPLKTSPCLVAQLRTSFHPSAPQRIPLWLTAFTLSPGSALDVTAAPESTLGDAPPPCSAQYFHSASLLHTGSRSPVWPCGVHHSPLCFLKLFLLC